jgi:hypothetical protein
MDTILKENNDRENNCKEKWINPFHKNTDSDIEITTFLYSTMKDCEIAKDLEHLKKRFHTWKLRDGRYKENCEKNPNFLDKPTKIFFATRDIIKNRSKNKILYFTDEKYVSLKPEITKEITKETNQKHSDNKIVFRIPHTFDRIESWILPEKMIKDLKCIEILCNHQVMVNVPEILIRNAYINYPSEFSLKVEDATNVFSRGFLVPLPELLIPSYYFLDIILTYNDSVKERRIDSEFILKTEKIENFGLFCAQIPIIDFSYTKMPISTDKNIFVINEPEISVGIFKKLTCIFEGKKGEFFPISSVEISWSQHSETNNTMNKMVIYRATDTLSHKKHVYTCKFKRPIVPCKIYESLDFQITLPENHEEGILHLILYTKNILNFGGGYIGKKHWFKRD